MSVIMVALPGSAFHEQEIANIADKQDEVLAFAMERVDDLFCCIAVLFANIVHVRKYKRITQLCLLWRDIAICLLDWHLGLEITLNHVTSRIKFSFSVVELVKILRTLQSCTLTLPTQYCRLPGAGAARIWCRFVWPPPLPHRTSPIPHPILTTPDFSWSDDLQNHCCTAEPLYRGAALDTHHAFDLHVQQVLFEQNFFLKMTPNS